MATIIRKPQQMKPVYEQVKDSFRENLFTIHNLLWQVVVNWVHVSETVTFYPEYDNNRHCIMMVFYGKKGYRNTWVEFAKGVSNREAQDICDYLNKNVFGQSQDESFRIVAQSF